MFQAKSNLRYLLCTTLVVLLFSAIDVQAQVFGPGCQMSKDFKFNFFISTDNKNSGLYGAMADRIPPTVVSNCRGASGKFLGFGLGLRQPYFSSDAADVSFDGDIRKEICEIKNSTFEDPMTFDEKKQLFDEQFKLLRQCTYLEITHLDAKPIQFNPNQNHCKMTKLPNGKVKAEGDFCYIRINPELRVALSVILRPECASSEFLVKNKLQYRDLEALLQAFVVEDDKSLVTENMIGTTKVRLSMMPESSAISVNQDAGPETAQFPTTFTADIHQGPIIIRDGSFGDDKKTFFDLSLMLDTRSARKCGRSGACVGPGDYQIPVAGEVELSEITASGKKQFLDSWYAGNPTDPFAKGHWQGIFRFGRKVSEGLEMQIGKTYEVQVNFYNPSDDYIMLIKGWEQILVDLTLMNGTAGKDFIQPMNALNSLLGLPEIPILPQLGSTEIEDQIEKVRQIMQKLGQDQTFPPYYLQVCDPLMRSCQKMNSHSKYLTLTTRFTIEGISDEDGSYILSKIQTNRDSHFLKNYRKTPTALPKLVCE